MAGVVPADDAERGSRYEVLFRSNYRAVENYVMSRYPGLDASAVLSSTFEVAWRRFDEIPTGAVRGWLIGVARNCARNELRGRQRRQRHVDAVIDARPANQGESPVTAEIVERLRTVLHRLSDSDREILLLADWDGLLGDDLGAALGISGATAAVRLHRARARMRRMWAEQEDSS